MFRNSFASVIAGSVTVCAGLTTDCPGQWQIGEFVTYSQDDWGTQGTAAEQLLFNHLPAVYPNGVEIGIPGAAGNSAIFTTLEAILDYLPASGSPAPLDNDYLDPTSTPAGFSPAT